MIRDTPMVVRRATEWKYLPLTSPSHNILLSTNGGWHSRKCPRMKQWRAFVKRHLSISLFKYLKDILNNHIFCFYLSKWWWESIWDNFLHLLLLIDFTFVHLQNSQLTWSVRDAVNMLMILNCVVLWRWSSSEETRWVARWCDAMSVCSVRG